MTDRVADLFHSFASEVPGAVTSRARGLAASLPEREPLPLAEGDVAGSYEIVRVLGSGGQAVVYEAIDRRLAKRVAVKVPRRDVGDRLVKEAKLVAGLGHPSIVQVLDLVLAGPTPFLVLELCDGGSLDEWLERSPEGMPIAEVHAIARSILEALSFAHRRGVVHRDVKPANILFDAGGRAKVSDFGIGTVARSDEVSNSVELSQLSLLAGTPLWVAPEQENPALRIGGRLDGRADLFAFGKVLFQMLTGASPRTIRPPSRLRAGLEPAWDDYVFKLIEERPEKRYASAAEALSAMPKPPPRVPSEDLVGPWVAGCEIQERIGETSDTILHRAWHEALRRDVVIEVLPPERSVNPRTKDRFLREARAGAGVSHPNLVRILDVGETAGGLPFVVREQALGPTLEDIARRSPTEWREAVRIVADLARALSAIHAAKLIHGDVKASNVVLASGGVPKLGCLRFARNLDSGCRLSAEGAMIEAPHWIAPEIGRVREVDGRADIYSLGLVLYFLLTAKQPLEGRSALDVLSAKAHRAITTPMAFAEIPVPVECVLAKMLEFEREKRYDDADALLRDLEALEKGLPLAARPAWWHEKPEDRAPPSLPPAFRLEPPRASARSSRNPSWKTSVGVIAVAALMFSVVSALLAGPVMGLGVALFISIVGSLLIGAFLLGKLFTDVVASWRRRRY